MVTVFQFDGTGMKMIQLLQCFVYLLFSSFKSFAVEFYGFIYLVAYLLFGDKSHY